VRSDRPQLRKAINALGEGDTLMVVRLDRLARSTRDLLNILHEVGEKGASFKSLHDAWADTTTPHGRLMLTVLGGLAEFERSLIKARTDVGIRRAREMGIRFGRPPKSPDSFSPLHRAAGAAEQKRKQALEISRRFRNSFRMRNSKLQNCKPMFVITRIGRIAPSNGFTRSTPR
jgi:DNA invertase Pin-like site-specific DNA recombinase